MKSKHLLEQRNLAKKKKPEFLRQCSGEKRKLGHKWRLPRGLHSKIRRNFRGHRKRVMVGFKSPSEISGLTRDGLKPILVNNKSQLNVLDKSHGIVVCSGVSQRNKIAIIAEAHKKGIVVLNYKNAEEKVKSIQKSFDERKLKRVQLLKRRKERKEGKKEAKETKGKETKKGKEMKKGASKKEDDKAEKAYGKEDFETKAQEHIIEEKKERDKILIQKD